MAEKQKKSLSAPKLRIILACSLALLVIIAVAAFIYFRSGLVNYAYQVQQDNAKAAVSTNDINKLKSMKQILDDNQRAVARAKSIVADSQEYKYQNQIIDDINEYAKQAGISISSYTFNTPTTGAGATPSSGASTPQVAAPAGLKTVSVSVNFKSQVNYQSYLRFIHYIELNLTKMQISGVSLSRLAASNTDVTASPITLEVYVK